MMELTSLSVEQRALVGVWYRANTDTYRLVLSVRLQNLHMPPFAHVSEGLHIKMEIILCYIETMRRRFLNKPQ